MSEQLDVATLPTISGFLTFLEAHAGEDAPLGQWGFFPNARGEELEATRAASAAGTQRWVGQSVFDASGLVEAFIKQPLEGTAAERLEHLYKEWCYGHVGDFIEEMVQLPGTAIFRADANGRFWDLGFLYRKNGEGMLDWDVFVCSDPQRGLCVEPMDESWTHWGLISMVMRYDVASPAYECPPVLEKNVPYGVVWSSVLNFRAKEDRRLVTSVPNGTVLPLTGIVDGDWTECILDKQTGYVFSRFLVKHNI